MRDGNAPDPAEEFHALLLAIFPELDEIRAPLPLVLRAIGELYHDDERLRAWTPSPGDMDRGQTYQVPWPLAP